VGGTRGEVRHLNLFSVKEPRARNKRQSCTKRPAPKEKKENRHICTRKKNPHKKEGKKEDRRNHQRKRGKKKHTYAFLGQGPTGPCTKAKRVGKSKGKRKRQFKTKDGRWITGCQKNPHISQAFPKNKKGKIDVAKNKSYQKLGGKKPETGKIEENPTKVGFFPQKVPRAPSTRAPKLGGFPKKKGQIKPGESPTRRVGGGDQTWGKT